jgi:hypothetical protein
MFVLFFTVAHAEDSQTIKKLNKPLSIEEISREDSRRRIFGNLEMFSKQKYSDCLKAFGDPVFCKCLEERIPIVIDFARYVKIVTSTKTDLQYDQADADTKKLIDLTLSVREACVSEKK